MQNFLLTINSTAIEPKIDFPVKYSPTFFGRKGTLKVSVSSFRKIQEKSPTANNVGVSAAINGKNLFVSIHAKSGTGISKYQLNNIDYPAIRQAISSEIRNYQGIVEDNPLGNFASFEGVSDPVLTDLIYGSAVMHTNIDDNQILFKDFALFSMPFCEKKYEKAKEILGYNPIIEFSAKNKIGVEDDFITLNSRLIKVKNYGVFLMKTPLFKEKIEILRKRFTKGKITFIVSEKEYHAQNVEFEDYFNDVENNVEFMVI